MDEVICFHKCLPALKQPQRFRGNLPEGMGGGQSFPISSTSKLSRTGGITGLNIFPSLLCFYLYFILLQRDEDINVPNLHINST